MYQLDEAQLGDPKETKLISLSWIIKQYQHLPLIHDDTTRHPRTSIVGSQTNRRRDDQSLKLALGQLMPSHGYEVFIFLASAYEGRSPVLTVSSSH